MRILAGGATSRGTSTTTQDLLVMSGGSGRFMTGQTFPSGRTCLSGSGGTASCREGVVYREVSTGFVFTPTILETEVRLEVTPFLSYFADEKEGSIVFYEAKTTLSIPDGQTVIIAENETDKGRFVGDIFSGFSGSSAKGNFYIAVTPMIVD